MKAEFERLRAAERKAFQHVSECAPEALDDAVAALWRARTDLYAFCLHFTQSELEDKR